MASNNQVKEIQVGNINYTIDAETLGGHSIGYIELTGQSWTGSGTLNSDQIAELDKDYCIIRYITSESSAGDIYLYKVWTQDGGGTFRSSEIIDSGSIRIFNNYINLDSNSNWTFTTEEADACQYDDFNYLLNSIFKNKEYTDRASKAYSVGDYFLWDYHPNQILKLYRVTLSIDQNAQFVVNSNVIEVKLTDELQNKISKSSTTGLVKNDGSINTTTEEWEFTLSDGTTVTKTVRLN